MDDEGETLVTHQPRSPGFRQVAVCVATLAMGALFVLSCGSPSPATPQPGQGQDVVRLGIQPIAQTDPALISSDSEVLIANQIYDYLVDIDPQNRITPRLAKDWDVSPDGLTYTFDLAKGVTFHDGSAFTAEDVVWTFDRLRDPASGYPTADLYSGVTGIRAAGDDRVVFSLAKTNPFFLFDLALGDEVETGSRDGHDLVFRRVARPSGHSTFRVWFRDPAIRGELAGEIRDLGCPTEWRSLTSNLLAVDAATRDLAQELAGLLAAREKAGGVMFESGRTK